MAFKIKILFSLFFLLSTWCIGQTDPIESLKLKFEKEQNDSVKAHLSVLIANKLKSVDPLQVIQYAQFNLDYQVKIEGEKLAEAYHLLAISYYYLGDENKSIEFFNLALNEYQDKSDHNKIASISKNLGDIYDENGRFNKALEYYMITETSKNILKESKGMSELYANMGKACLELSMHDSAFEYLKKAKKLDVEYNDQFRLIYDNANFGRYYRIKEDPDSALYYYSRAYYLLKEEHLFEKMMVSVALAEIYMQKKNIPIAMKYGRDAVQLANNLGSVEGQVDAYDMLARIFEVDLKFDSAYYYHNRYAVLKDSMFNENMQDRVQKVEKSYLLQKRQNEINNLTEKNSVTRQKEEQTRLVSYMLLGLLILLIFIIIMIVRRNKFRARVYALLRRQRNHIIDKNREVVESIQYAKGIQETILPNNKDLEALFPAAFCWYKACDIVNGDFFWVSKVKEGRILAVVDCTGHGVPGAFMTVIASSLLNKTIKEKGIMEPAEILNALSLELKLIINANRQSILNENGFDIGICLFSEDLRKVKFSGAKRPLYLIKDKEINVYPGNKRSIGLNISEDQKPFTQVEIDLSPGNRAFMFSDGVVDQFGGDHDKKFMQHRLKQFIKSNQTVKVNDLEGLFDKTMRDWKRNNLQTDDMLLVGLQIE